MESITRASIIINDKVKNPIRAFFMEDTVSISCETALGKVSDSIGASVSGEGLQIGFNNRFMLDALKVVSSDEVLLEMSTPLSPIKLVPLEGDFFTYLVMPMRLKE